MKAPYDKLFLDPVVAKNPVNAVQYLENEIEYIRKDSLLKWANNELENNVGQYSRDYDLAINFLIDKLNTL